MLPRIVNLKNDKNKKKYNIKSLQDPCTRAKLQESLSSCLVDHPSAGADVDHQWDALTSAIHKVCTETIGDITRKHQDWFNDNDMEIRDLLDCKEVLNLPLAKWHYFSPEAERIPTRQRLKAETQKRIRDIKHKRWKEKAQMIHGFADHHDMHNFFQGHNNLSMGLAQISTSSPVPR